MFSLALISQMLGLLLISNIHRHHYLNYLRRVIIQRIPQNNIKGVYWAPEPSLMSAVWLSLWHTVPLQWEIMTSPINFNIGLCQRILLLVCLMLLASHVKMASKLFLNVCIIFAQISSAKMSFFIYRSLRWHDIDISDQKNLKITGICYYCYYLLKLLEKRLNMP